MRARKGFLHIIEIIIISVIVFAMMFQFTYIPPITTDFDSTKLRLAGNDILASLDRQGINWLDRQEVDSALSDLLKNTSILYEVEIRNAIKTPLAVACICSATEAAELQGILDSVTLNGQKNIFNVTRLPLPQDINATGIPLRYDVAVIYDYDLAQPGVIVGWDLSSTLNTFLRAGKGVIHMRDLTDATFAVDPRQTSYYQNVFGLDYNNSVLNPSSNSLQLTVPNTSRYFLVHKLFYNTPFYEQDFDSNQNDFVQFTGGWVRAPHPDDPTNMLLANTNFGLLPLEVIEFTRSLPVNYRVRFDYFITSEFGAGKHIAWTYFFDNGADINSTDFGAIGSTVPAPLQNRLVVSQHTPPTVFTILKTSPFANIVTSSANPADDFHTLDVIKKANDFELRGLSNESDNGVLTHSKVFSPGVRVGIFANYSSVVVDNFKVHLAEPHTFGADLGAQEKISAVGLDNTGRQLLRDPVTGYAGVIVNEAVVDGRGRTVWITGASDNTIEERKVLIKTLVMWAAGQSRELITNPVKAPITSSYYTVLNKDFFQPIEVVIKFDTTF